MFSADMGYLGVGLFSNGGAVRSAFNKPYNPSFALRSDGGGSSGYRLALGVTDENGAELLRFARQRNAKTYWDFYPDGQFTTTRFNTLINGADEIHFNTNNFNFHKFGNWALRDGKLRIPGTITNYELRTILQPKYQPKVKF